MTDIGGTIAITFHGVRGSTPCHGDATARYGGNTSCVSLDVPGHDPVLFDLGTGLRYFGLNHGGGSPFRGTCLLSHLHWDHLQGLPFFTPLLAPGAHLEVYAPAQEDGRPLADVMADFLRPPVFPVRLGDFPGLVTFRDVADDEFTVGEIAVTSRLIPHIGNTCGFRVEWGGRSVAYLSDHQQPGVGDHSVSEGARHLCDGVDVLIHDAQYTATEFARKSTWGHCSIDYAASVAVECGVRTLVLFHHDPAHDDAEVDRMACYTSTLCAATGVEVIAAHEGLELQLET